MTEQENYGFDPSLAIQLIIENKDLQLALLQIPILFIKNWAGINKQLTWEDLPKFPGYYWTKDSNGSIGVTFIGPETIPTYKSGNWKFAGPLIPPK